MKTMPFPKIFRKIKGLFPFLSSFSNFKHLYFRNLQMDFDNVKTQNIISIFIYQISYLLLQNPILNSLMCIAIYMQRYC